MDTVGQRIKAVRKALKMTQAQFAKEILVGWETVAAWEQGKAKPGKSRLYMIEEKFGVSLHWLETGEGDMYKPAPPPILIGDVVDEKIYFEAMKRLYDSLPESAKKAFQAFCEYLRNHE